MDITEIKHEEVPREDISLRTIKHRPKTEVKKYEVDKREVSKNIQEFDKKVKVFTKDPYKFNSVSLKKSEVVATPTASQMATDPLYSAIGKVLGVDVAKEWNKYYDKVYEIANWAKRKTKTSDMTKIIKFITDQERRIPSFGARRIDDIHIYVNLSQSTK